MRLSISFATPSVFYELFFNFVKVNFTTQTTSKFNKFTWMGNDKKLQNSSLSDISEKMDQFFLSLDHWKILHDLFLSLKRRRNQ